MVVLPQVYSCGKSYIYANIITYCSWHASSVRTHNLFCNCTVLWLDVIMAYCSWLAFYAFFLNYKLQYADGPPLIISAIATVVTVAEILKNNGLAVAKSKILVTYTLVLFIFVSVPNHSIKMLCRDHDVHSWCQGWFKESPYSESQGNILPVYEIK